MLTEHLQCGEPRCIHTQYISEPLPPEKANLLQTYQHTLAEIYRVSKDVHKIETEARRLSKAPRSLTTPKRSRVSSSVPSSSSSSSRPLDKSSGSGASRSGPSTPTVSSGRKRKRTSSDTSHPPHPLPLLDGGPIASLFPLHVGSNPFPANTLGRPLIRRQTTSAGGDRLNAREGIIDLTRRTTQRPASEDVIDLTGGSSGVPPVVGASNRALSPIDLTHDSESEAEYF